jgi:hypothetical protein
LDLTLLFWRFLRWLLRTRRAADFVFGIDCFIFAKEPQSLVKRAGMSTAKKICRRPVLTAPRRGFSPDGKNRQIFFHPALLLGGWLVVCGDSLAE